MKSYKSDCGVRRLLETTAENLTTEGSQKNGIKTQKGLHKKRNWQYLAHLFQRGYFEKITDRHISRVHLLKECLPFIFSK